MLANAYSTVKCGFVSVTICCNWFEDNLWMKGSEDEAGSCSSSKVMSMPELRAAITATSSVVILSDGSSPFSSFNAVMSLVEQAASISYQIVEKCE